jgi:hypothetical protein
MFDRRLRRNLPLTAALAVFVFFLSRDSKPGFETRLAIGLSVVLLIAIWSKQLRERRATSAVLSTCLMGSYLVLFWVERGPGDLGTIMGGLGFLAGLAWVVVQWRSKTAPDDEVQ